MAFELTAGGDPDADKVMTALQMAGSMVGGTGMRSFGSTTPVYGATLGVRSLREDYAKPVNRPAIVTNLKIIEEKIAQKEGISSEDRTELPRFQHLFKGGDLFPVAVFCLALEMHPTETLNGRAMPFDGEVLVLRDNLVAAYKPLVVKIRALLSKEIADLPQRLLMNFAKAWSVWESAWLQNREIHAVEALQPLAKAILSLEPLLLSVSKERLLPWPRVKHQKVVTLKCLEGFVHSFSELSGSVLPSLRRELDPDPRLLLLMDHVLMLRGDQRVGSCLKGVAATPEVGFPDHSGNQNHGDRDPTMAPTAREKGKGLALDQYAFKLLGASVGDAVAAGKVDQTLGRPPMHRDPYNTSTGVLPGVPFQPVKESHTHKKSANHAAELLSAFEGVKDMLLSLKSTLEYIDPGLDEDEAFVATIERFERAFRKAKRSFLEPDNLA